MTDAAAAAHPGAEVHIDHTAKSQDASASHSWAADFASSVWGAAKVAGDVALGAAHEIVEHPLKTAAEIGTGVVLAAAAAELGVGVVAGAAVGGVVLAGYGVVRGVQIASKEGIGAIPAHMKETYQEVKHSAGDVLSAASTIYHGDTGHKADEAAAKLENVGRGALPFAAVALGGAGGEAGQMLFRGGAQILDDILPALTFEPAYAYAGGGIMGGAIATTPGRIGAGQIAAAAETAGTAMHMSDAGEGGGGGSGRSDWDRQQEFITGRKGPVRVVETEGEATTIGHAFKDIDGVMAKGGKVGHYKFTSDGKGLYTVEVEAGALKGRTGIWQKGDPTFHFDSGNGGSSEFPVK